MSLNDPKPVKSGLTIWLLFVIFYFLYKSLDYFMLSGAAYIAKESPVGMAHPDVLESLSQQLKIMAAITRFCGHSLALL